MIFHPDKRLLWHPRYDNKFVVGGGTQITLYEITSEYPELRHVTSQHDLTHMKCFAWSPDPAYDDLMAVGNRDGKVELIRLEAGKQSLRTNALSSGSRVTLPARTSRNVHALAFSDAEPSHLAVGTDKYRGESSIFIWNINSRAPTVQLSFKDNTDHARTETLPPRQRQSMFPRSDNQPPRDPRIISQHSSAEVVSSLAFVPHSPHLLAAALSFRWLRFLDLRAKPGIIVNHVQVALKAQTIAMDPMDEYRVACTADDTVNIFDRRKLAYPILSFTERDALADGARFKTGTMISTLEFSSTRRGCLATLERDSSYVRFWDLMQCQPNVLNGKTAVVAPSEGDARSNKDISRPIIKRSGWGLSPYPWSLGGNKQTQLPKDVPTSRPGDQVTQSTVVISDTRRTKYFPRPLSSFALAPKRNGPALTSNVMVVNKEGDLELHAIHDTKKQICWSSRGDFAIGAGLGIKILPGYREGETDASYSYLDKSPERRDNPERRRDTSRSRSRGNSRSRGRTGGSVEPPERAPQPPLFGRGDADGFPALSSAHPKPMAGLSASRPGTARNYSPASVRKYRSTERGEPSTLLRRSLSRTSRTDTIRAVDEPVQMRQKSVERPIPVVKPPVRKQGVENIVQDDVSMIMRRRAKAGYGLSIPRDNITLIQCDDLKDVASQMLSDFWSWLYFSNGILGVPTTKVHGFDFAYQGLQGIWEGFPPSEEELLDEDTPVAVQRSLLDTPVPTRPSRRSRSPADTLHGNWSAAIATLAARHNLDRWSWLSPITTNRLLQRKLALLTCGWTLKKDELASTIARFEADGEISKAACWLVFTNQASQAAEVLMRSNDDTHQMMSGTVAALAPLSGRNMELRGHFAHLILRLHDPYLRMMLAHLAMGDWAEVLDEEVIPFRERLIIAFQFLDDNALTSYLKRTVKNAAKHGDIDALVVSGLTKRGMRILQAYVDRTADVQSAAILSSYVCPHKFKDKKADRWLESYRDLLDGFKLHHLRVGFDIERGQIIQGDIHNGDAVPKEWAPRQILIRCHYCNKPVRHTGVTTQHQGKPTNCENCNRELPRCSVCLITLSIVHDAAREIDLGYTHHRDTFDDAIVICQTCRHGGHAVHILEWFLGEETGRTHDVCPVADCNCRCAEEM